MKSVTGANRPPFKGGSRAVWVVSSFNKTASSKKRQPGAFPPPLGASLGTRATASVQDCSHSSACPNAPRRVPPLHTKPASEHPPVDPLRLCVLPLARERLCKIARQTGKYKLLCQQRAGVWTSTDHLHDSVECQWWYTGGMPVGEQFQREYWNPHWIRVAAEDEAMNIGPWAAKKRKAFWQVCQIRGRTCRL
jgi:hypothetical protein